MGTIYRGQAPKTIYLKYLLIPISLFVLAVTIAFFPAPGYTPLFNHVSDMGGIARNQLALFSPQGPAAREKRAKDGRTPCPQTRGKSGTTNCEII